MCAGSPGCIEDQIYIITFKKTKILCKQTMSFIYDDTL